MYGLSPLLLRMTAWNCRLLGRDFLRHQSCQVHALKGLYQFPTPDLTVLAPHPQHFVLPCFLRAEYRVYHCNLYFLLTLKAPSASSSLFRLTQITIQVICPFLHCHFFPPVLGLEFMTSGKYFPHILRQDITKLPRLAWN